MSETNDITFMSVAVPPPRSLMTPSQKTQPQQRPKVSLPDLLIFTGKLVGKYLF